MNKKKILVDIYYLHVAQTGIKTYIECLCREIEKQESTEFEFIVSPDFQKICRKNFFKGKTALWKNLLFQLLYFFRKLVVLPLLSVRHNASIVFSPDILSPPWARGIKVSVIHDAFFWENPSHYNPLWLKSFLGFLKGSLKRNARVVTVSEYSKKQLRKYLNMQELPIYVVYPASGLSPKQQPSGARPLISKPYFLHVGVMERRKNLPTLVSAFSRLLQIEGCDDFRLVLVGQRGPREALDDWDTVVSMVRELNLEGKVLLPGFVDARELENYYRHAIGYVFPSTNEGFGMPVLEAFSFGVPVIIANQGALLEVGGEAVLAVRENTAAGFEQAMYVLSQDKSLREALVLRGHERLRKFSPANFFLSLQDCFRKILHE